MAFRVHPVVLALLAPLASVLFVSCGSGGESGGGLGYLIILSLGTLNSADMMVALLSLGVIGIVMALGIKQLEMRLLRWRPEYRRP